MTVCRRDPKDGHRRVAILPGAVCLWSRLGDSSYGRLSGSLSLPQRNRADCGRGYTPKARNPFMAARHRQENPPCRKAVKRPEGEPSTILDRSDTTSGGHAAPPRPPTAEPADPFHHPASLVPTVRWCW